MVADMAMVVDMIRGQERMDNMVGGGDDRVSGGTGCWYGPVAGDDRGAGYGAGGGSGYGAGVYSDGYGCGDLIHAGDGELDCCGSGRGHGSGVGDDYGHGEGCGYGCGSG